MGSRAKVGGSGSKARAGAMASRTGATTKVDSVLAGWVATPYQSMTRSANEVGVGPEERGELLKYELATQGWLESDHDWMRRMDRGEIKKDEGFARFNRVLDAAPVYRGDLKRVIRGDPFKSLAVGDTFTLDAMSSFGKPDGVFSVRSSQSWLFVKNGAGRDISAKNPMEQEVVVRRGASFRVVSIRKSIGVVKREIFVEQIGGGE